MQAISITYGILAWLSCWWIDITVALLRSPLWIDLIFKFGVVTICLLIIIVSLVRRRGLFNFEP
jgi:hypothetical protein